MQRIILACILVVHALPVFAQRLGFIPIPPGQQIVLRAERADVPLGPIVVPFTKGWSFRWINPVFAGLAPDGLKFEATYTHDPLAVRDSAKQQAFASDNRRSLPGFQSKWASEFGHTVRPCVEEPQPLGRFRVICAAERGKDDKTEYLIAYAYVGKWAVVFLNFYGNGKASDGFERVEAILSDARWDDEAAQPPVAADAPPAVRR